LEVEEEMAALEKEEARVEALEQSEEKKLASIKVHHRALAVAAKKALVVKKKNVAMAVEAAAEAMAESDQIGNQDQDPDQDQECEGEGDSIRGQSTLGFKEADLVTAEAADCEAEIAMMILHEKEARAEMEMLKEMKPLYLQVTLTPSHS